MRRILLGFVALAVAMPVTAQKPTIFDVSDVVIGAQRIQTRYLYTAGKWSDSGDHTGPLSTQIQCYKSLGFCDVATAVESFGDAEASLDTFEVRIWNSSRSCPRKPSLIAFWVHS